MTNQDTTVIPYGSYCYDGNIRCPYWVWKQITHDQKVPRRVNDKDEVISVSIPYCLYLDQGDVFGISKEEFDELKHFHNMTNEELWEKYPLDLLWDACKECGENDD
jgi:hypothetical protein